MKDNFCKNCVCYIKHAIKEPTCAVTKMSIKDMVACTCEGPLRGAPPKELCVKTPLGLLCAVAGGDPDYPEIFAYLRRPDGIEVDLAVVGAYDGENGGAPKARAYLYGDTKRDDWTESHEWSADEINFSEEGEQVKC